MEEYRLIAELEAEGVGQNRLRAVFGNLAISDFPVSGP
jgi:hypothetical protein